MLINYNLETSNNVQSLRGEGGLVVVVVVVVGGGGGLTLRLNVWQLV